MIQNTSWPCPPYGNDEIHEGYERFRQELQQLTAVQSSSLAGITPGDNAYGIVSTFEGMESAQNFATSGVDYDYLETFGMELLAGRSFSRDIPSDRVERVIINRKICDRFGWTPEEAIGKTYDFGGDGVTPGSVIGVVEDFHFNSLHDEIYEMAFVMYPAFYQKIAIRLHPGPLKPIT